MTDPNILSNFFSAPCAVFPRQLLAKSAVMAAAILCIAMNSTAVHAELSSGIANTAIAGSVQTGSSSSLTLVAPYSATSPGDRLAANLNAEPRLTLGLAGSGALESETKVLSSSRLDWLIPSVLLLFAVLLAGLNTRRGRKTPTALQGI